MSFLNLRIRGRLYGGFGALLLFCAALAGFAVWQLGRIPHQVAAMTLQSKNTIRVGEIATNLAGDPRGVLRYAFDQDESILRRIRQAFEDGVIDLLDGGRAGRPESEERRAAYKEIDKDIAGTEGQARSRSARPSSRCRRAAHCCSPTATRWRPTSRNSWMPRQRRRSSRPQRFSRSQGSSGPRRELADAGDPRPQGDRDLQDQCRKGAAADRRTREGRPAV